MRGMYLEGKRYSEGWVAFLLCCVFLLVGCGASTTSEPAEVATQPPTNPPIIGPDGVEFTPIPPPPAWREPSAVITRENVAQTELLGRLDASMSRSTLFSITFSPDGTQLAALNNDRVAVWDLISGQQVVDTARRGASDLYFSPDKTEFYTLNPEGVIRVHDSQSGQILTDFLGHPDFSNAVAYDNETGHMAIGGADGTVKVWDPLERTSLVTFDAHDDEIDEMVFSIDGTRLATVGLDNIVRIWEWSSGTEIATLDNSQTVVRRLAFRPDGEQIAVSTSGAVAIWSIPDETYLFGLQTGGPTDVVQYSPDGRFLITGGAIPDTVVWDAQTGELVALLPGVGGDVVSISFSPDGELLLAAVLDGPVTLWDMTSITSETVSQATLDVGTARVIDLAFTSDGFSMLFFDAVGPVYVWGIPPSADAPSE